ncbi:meiosis initiator protein [Echinops telfairi]|uniref:Meiosis initiator protein n=1 Tax=Echinops telfairi TaxID=9371 RepID=A0AC55D9U3_ECHTE|nr:meiosis initiator protein [Echinops telfairi]
MPEITNHSLFPSLQMRGSDDGDSRDPEWPKTSSLGPSDSRTQRANHTKKLQELALLLPVALMAGNKKLTKKEILLHVLHYIQYLQKSIDVAKALLRFYTTERKHRFTGLARKPPGSPARQRHSTPSSSPCARKSQLQGACRKPQKKKPGRTSERQTRAQKPRRCLALCKSEVTSSPEQTGENLQGANLPLRCWDFSRQLDDAALSPCPGCCVGACAQDDETFAAPGVLGDAERICLLNGGQACPWQKLLCCDSSEEVKEYDPWLPVWTPKDNSEGSLLALEPPQDKDWSATGQPSEVLGLSPSIFSSPGKLLFRQILADGEDYLTQVLFEEVDFGPDSPPWACVSDKDILAEDPEDSREADDPLQSSVLSDDCYLSQSDTSEASSSAGSETTETESLCWQLEESQDDVPEDGLSSSEEDGDYTWTPTRRTSLLPPNGRKAKSRAAKAPVKSKESWAAPGQSQRKKKCVNGFIMFCRMNRKQYIRACPGTASTTATKELAQLWRAMTPQERKPYCTKARRFSRQHNRIVKQDRSSSEDDDDWEPPKPFYQLLANKARREPGPRPRRQ